MAGLAYRVGHELAANTIERERTLQPPAKFAVGTQRLNPLRGVVESDTREHTRAVFDEHELAGIVHDLKSPLAAISLEATLLDERSVRSDSAGQARGVARIQHNVAFMDRLIMDLLDMCQLAGGKLPLEREHTELRTLIEHVVERCVPMRERHRISLDAEQIVAVIDPLRIERVLANLIDNALAYTPHSAGVVIRLERSRGYACVSVIDAGPGIAPEELPNMFKKYSRGEAARGQRGNGLGLHVSKRIIEAHGGRIGVDSIRGAGSRFFFEVPAS